ncbi:MAG TPA: glycosyltransferase family 1 protein [Vicinamibacterales bacterium]|nr:glycosyltransferase family 1 protein [Vicinamibacterales bacterium]
MRVAVDARELAGRPTGVGRYLAELLDRWGGSPDARRHEWRFYAHRPVSIPPALASSSVVIPGAGGTRWEQASLARALGRERPDVLFAPGYTAPLAAACPVALTIHDVSFAAHPEWFSFREGLRRRTLTAWSARRARLVITDSQFSRGEIARHIGIASKRIRVIPLGIRRPASNRNIERTPVILYVGSIFRRRHVDTLIDVFVNHVAHRVPGSRLEIVGENRMHPPGDPARALASCPAEIARRVTIRSYVDETTLGDLYQGASVFAFLSSYEGFGLTPLEALAAGLPPVVLDTPVAREVYGAAASYVADLRSPAPLADALTELLTAPQARRAVLAQADAVLARYDWNRAADATLRALEEAAGV